MLHLDEMAIIPVALFVEKRWFYYHIYSAIRQGFPLSTITTNNY